MKKKRLQYISLLLFLTYLLNLCVPCLPVQAEATSAPVSLTEDTSFSDIAGHWAEKGIKAWTTRQLAGGLSRRHFPTGQSDYAGGVPDLSQPCLWLSGSRTGNLS